ncbi:MAG: oligosaccharide flippase family protein [Roseiarcus sp.]
MTERPSEHDTSSYRQIFVSASIIGGASIINIVIAVIRTKIIAIILGPVGVGLFALFGALMSTGIAFATAGIWAVGIRQIAEAHAHGEAHSLAVARRALFFAALALSIVGGGAVWLLRDLLAKVVFHDPATAPQIGLLGVGVALSVASCSQGALIQGMRRIRDLASISIGTGLLTTLIGVPLLWSAGASGVVWYVILTPVVSFALGHWFVARLPKTPSGSVRFSQLAAQWATFLRLGPPFAAAGIANTMIQLWIRADVQSQLGPAALGHFQASWTIGMQYMEIVLGAMVADYFPRLTAVMFDHSKACRLVNEHTEVALLLTGSAMIVMLAMAPWVIGLLYTPEFAPAADMLRWLAAGGILKIASFPLTYAILAAGAGRTFFLTQVSTLLLMAGAIHYLLPQVGVVAGGVGYLIAYVYYLPLAFVLNARCIGFRWSAEVGFASALLFPLCAITVGSILLAPAWAAIIGWLAAAIYGFFAFRRLRQMGIVSAVVAKLATAGGGLAKGTIGSQ